mmetsp:Transcript_32190/g.86154  ORF Transcript_32190/g.86154 Transcript_32190/m.86154 type:complete len:295 (-) Transcript_32190:382-1266(-)
MQVAVPLEGHVGGGAEGELHRVGPLAPRDHGHDGLGNAGLSAWVARLLLDAHGTLGRVALGAAHREAKRRWGVRCSEEPTAVEPHVIREGSWRHLLADGSDELTPKHALDVVHGGCQLTADRGAVRQRGRKPRLGGGGEASAVGAGEGLRQRGGLLPQGPRLLLEQEVHVGEAQERAAREALRGGANGGDETRGPCRSRGCAVVGCHAAILAPVSFLQQGEHRYQWLVAADGALVPRSLVQRDVKEALQVRRNVARPRRHAREMLQGIPDVVVATRRVALTMHAVDAEAGRGRV